MLLDPGAPYADHRVVKGLLQQLESSLYSQKLVQQPSKHNRAYQPITAHALPELFKSSPETHKLEQIPLMSYEETLLAKLQSLKEVVERVREEDDEVPPLYSFEHFCRDLDVHDVYVQRLLELLVRETARSSSESITKKGVLTQVIVEE